MKKLLVLCLFVSVIMLGCVRESDIDHNTCRNTYNIEVAYEPAERQITGVERLIYNNCYNSDKIYFHLYPNIYNKKETSPEYNIFTDSYPNDFNPGWIDIKSVELFGEDVKYNIEDTILEIDIPGDVRKADKLDIKICFTALLPNAKSRFGVYNQVANVSYWYPILCMYDEGKWDKEGFYFIGESSYSDVADYNVKITLPEEYVVCATGNKTNERKLQNKTIEAEYEERSVRDFVWFASNKFKTKQKNIDGITINYFYLDDINDKPAKVLGAASSIIDYYNKSFGYYPYKQFNIVKSEVGTSEFPQAITIADSNLGTHDSINYALAHEIAHQWWYLTIGNNQREEPWLDEAFAVHSMNMYLREKYGQEFIDNIILEKEEKKAAQIPVNSSVDKFTNFNTYSSIIYDRGSIILYNLNNRVGDSVFNSILKEYYNRYKFKNAKIKDFISIVKEVAGSENAKWLKAELENTNHPVKEVTKNVSYNYENIKLEKLEKLKNGQFTRVQLDSSTTKVICKPIIYNKIEEMDEYGSFIPLIKHNILQEMPFTEAYIYPMNDHLEMMNTKIDDIRDYEVSSYDELDNLAYLFGELDKNFIMISLFSLDNGDGLVHENYNYILSHGNKVGDDIYHFNKNGCCCVASVKTFDKRKYGITIISNTIDEMAIISLIKKDLFK